MKFLLINFVILSLILNFGDCYYKPKTDEGSAESKLKKLENYSDNIGEESESEENEKIGKNGKIEGNGL